MHIHLPEIETRDVPIFIGITGSSDHQGLLKEMILLISPYYINLSNFFL